MDTSRKTAFWEAPGLVATSCIILGFRGLLESLFQLPKENLGSDHGDQPNRGLTWAPVGVRVLEQLFRLGSETARYLGKVATCY